MDRLRAWIQQNRRAAIALAVLAVLAGFLVGRSILGGAPETAAPPTPPPAAEPAPAPAPPAAEQPPEPEQAEAAAPEAVVPTGPVGRSDPFVPLLVEARPGTPAPGPAAGPTPPPAPPLPPPPFPGAPGAPGTPGAAEAPGAEAPPPPPPEAGVVLLGIIGDSRSVVIVSVDGKTDILFEGESSGNVRVVKIDAVRGVVTFERAGEQFELTMGGE